MATSTLQNSWKATLESIPTKSELSLHSLWELLYTNDGILRGKTSSGLSLKHNIICYNSLLYRGGNTVYNESASVSINNKNYDATDLYNVFGIDASIAQYDSRAKHKEIKVERTIDKAQVSKGVVDLLFDTELSNYNEVGVFQGNKVILYDKKSVLEPTNETLFVQRGLYVAEAAGDFNTDYIPSKSYIPPYVDKLLTIDNGSLDQPIYLLSEDIGFRGTLSTAIEYSAYNKILFNYNNVWTAGFVLKALQNQITYLRDDSTGFFKFISDGKFWLNTENTDYHTYAPANSTDIIDFVFLTLPSIIDNKPYKSFSSIGSESIWRQILEHTFIWVKAPFFGDYIMPNVFNQDLNQDADVKHKNIVLSAISDFNRYDVDINSATKDIESLPYVPVASPSVDMLTRKLAGLEQDRNLSSLSDNEISGIITKGDEDDSVIGGILMASETRSGDSHIAQPGYWDPESKKESTEYQLSADSTERNLRHLPTIIPSSGNLFMDGRILSPTIDELWVYLKELTSGRKSDVFLDSNNATQYRKDSVADEDTAIPIGTNDKQKRQNDEDTRLNSVPETEYTLDYKSGTHNIYGDIIGIKTGIDDNYNQTIDVTKVVNSNDAIAYTLFGAIKKLSEDITTFDSSETNERSIFNFTAWDSTDSGRTNNNTITDGQVVTAAVAELWAPRHVPYSLRELEAFVKGNKFNIITLARFIKENFGVTGKLGIVTSDDNFAVFDKNDNFIKFISSSDLDENDEYPDLPSGSRIERNTKDNAQAGSLYQFHRNYNFNVASPNTWFNQFGEGTPNTGTGADFDGTPYSTATDDTYGDSENINKDQNKYSSSDVYMAADGTWRYVFDHVRIPIIHVKY